MTIREIRERTLRARHLMQRARRQKFAVGAFNIDNQETLIAVARAAKKLNAPVMVELSQSEVDAMGLDNVRDMVDNYRAEYGVEMYINLDHAPSVETAKAGIDAGFEFIHIDISGANKDASLIEIVNATREVVEYAKFTGAVVESEPNPFLGTSNLYDTAIDAEAVKQTLTWPELARKFVEATGVDTFAAAIGNLHGKYQGSKELDLELLAEIRAALDCNISLHGGSGTPAHYFEQAAKIGVSKVNINTEMRIAFRQTLEKALVENPHEYAVVKLMPPVYDAVQSVVEEKIKMFGSENKAVL